MTLTKTELVELHKSFIIGCMLKAFEDSYYRYYSMNGEGILHIVVIETPKKKEYYELKLIAKKTKTPAGCPKDMLKEEIANALASKINHYMPCAASLNDKGITVSFGNSFYDVAIIKKVKKPENFEKRTASIDNFADMTQRFGDEVNWIKQASRN